jgi:hypothetical protein
MFKISAVGVTIAANAMSFVAFSFCKKDTRGQCRSHHELHDEVEVRRECGARAEKSPDWKGKGPPLLFSSTM